VELPAAPEQSKATITVSYKPERGPYRRPRHRSTTPMRDAVSEVRYLMGRIGLIVLLLMTAIVLIVGSIVAVSYLFIFFLQRYTQGP
jgi:hypothetical protein